jgi:hypothetical protein
LASAPRRREPFDASQDSTLDVAGRVVAGIGDRGHYFIGLSKTGIIDAGYSNAGRASWVWINY